MVYHAVTQTDKPILVTGTTGRQGGTGRAVAKVLVERGLPVRALVRTLDEPANSFGDKALSWISGVDVGSLAASLLINADAVKRSDSHRRGRGTPDLR
jgi:NAD(P)-dependent dehydrogenase (short-subunit alcohol dehydrogenase family)